MGNIGGMNGSDVQRAHLALVGGTAVTASSAADGAGSLARTAATRGSIEASRTATVYGSATVDGARSRHETGVRAVAKSYDDFESALLPMVLASGVTGEAAVAVAEAIASNDQLRAQAERAFQRARLESV